MEILEQKSTVMVIDDSPDEIARIVGLLDKSYKLKVTSSGEKALKYLSQNFDIDLILLDILMPNIDGFEVCKQIKS